MKWTVLSVITVLFWKFRPEIWFLTSMILVCSGLDKGVHGWNMAAADPAKSPKRQKIAEEEVETCGEKTEAVESGCGARQKDENTCIKTGGSPNDEQRADVGSDGGGCVASHSEVTVESGAGADKTTCILPEDLRAAEKMAEASGSDQRPFDWSETEDNGKEAQTHAEENDKCGMLTLLMYFTVSFSLRG